MFVSLFMKHCAREILAACWFLLCFGIGSAELPVVELEPYEVSAGSRLSTWSEEASAVSVVSERTLAGYEDDMNAFPGVVFNVIGGLGGTSELIIRGAEPNFFIGFSRGIRSQ
jgi:hypothetical protein